MSRKSAREVVFKLIFENCFHKPEEGITYEEFLSLKHQYEDDVKTFKITFDKKYAEQVKTLELNANNKLLNIKDEANKKISDLEEKLSIYNDEVNDELSLFKTETIKFYDNKILELCNTINNLNNKIFELENVLEDILNEDWYNKW